MCKLPVNREAVLNFISGQACTDKPVPDQDEARATKVMAALRAKSISGRLANVRFALSGSKIWVAINDQGGISLRQNSGAELVVF